MNKLVQAFKKEALLFRVDAQDKTPGWIARHIPSIKDLNTYRNFAVDYLDDTKDWPKAGKYGSIKINGDERQAILEESLKLIRYLRDAENMALNIKNIAERVHHAFKSK